MHRDLKPANLMLGGIPHDSTDRDIAAELGVVKIADFGLSKSLAQNVDAARSRSNMDLSRKYEDGMEGHQLERCAAPSNAIVTPAVKRHTLVYSLRWQPGVCKPSCGTHASGSPKTHVHAFTVLL